MAARVLASLLLVIVGSALDVPIAIVLGLVVIALEVVHAAFARQGLRRIEYARRLDARRVPFGGEIPMTIEVWNRRSLPLSWLRADDEASPGIVFRERPLADRYESGTEVLRNAWTLRPFERVVRRLHVGSDRRGVFTLGPVDLAVGDPFARRAAEEQRPGIDRFLVWPRTVPTTEVEPPDRWGDIERARQGLAEDPSRFAGIRPYAPGDPTRRIHVRTSARLDRPVVKRFEPSREREVLIALDVQVSDGPVWTMSGDDRVEALYVIAASIARSLGARRVAFGLVAAGYTGAETRFARIAPSSAPGQVERVLDLLARLSSHASAPYERLLSIVARTVRPGTTVLALTARDPRPFAASLRRLERIGADVVVIAAGRDAASAVAGARAAGFVARRATLDGEWRTAAQLVIAP